MGQRIAVAMVTAVGALLLERAVIAGFMLARRLRWPHVG